MRINTVTLAVSAMTVLVLGIAAVPALGDGQQKPAAKSAATPTAITVYKTPT